jgi:hypothetical protein
VTVFEASPEHSPMSGIDEYLVHNYPHPVRVMWTTDAQAYERVWFTAQDDAGELLVVCGLAFYPNLGTAEAFAIVNHDGRHTTVRAHRLLGDNRMDMRVGPIAFEVVEPFREWRLTLDENDCGTTYDIRWYDTKRAVFRNLGAGTIAGGKPFGGVAGYDGFGVQEGHVHVDGRRFDLGGDHYNGTRDTTGVPVTVSEGGRGGRAGSTSCPVRLCSSPSGARGPTTSCVPSVTLVPAAPRCAGEPTGCASRTARACSSEARSTWSSRRER